MKARWLLTISLVAVLGAVPAEERASAAQSEDEPAPVEADKAPAASRQPGGGSDQFSPSEQISADSVVSFPVDI